MQKPTGIKHQKFKDLSLSLDSEERESQRRIKSKDPRETPYSLKITRRFTMSGPAKEELILKSEKPQRFQLKNQKRLNPRKKNQRRQLPLL
jgi:hypothetical protein